MKKVLILTASTGDGHNKAAEALIDIFAANNFVTAKFDFLKNANPKLNSFVVDGYKLLASSFPMLYGNLYRFSNFKGFNRKLPGILLDSIENGILEAVNSFNPDIIIGTHAFSVSIVSKLKVSKKIVVPFISIVTDFKAHSSYISENVDAYITGSEYTSVNLLRKNVPEYKVYPFGIPIRKDFLSDKEFKDKMLGEYFNVLLMGGGMGLKFIAPVLGKLMENEHKLDITVVCGNNNMLKEALDKIYCKEVNNKKVHILGFTNNIPELMEKAEVIITKPGGLTVSEAIVKRLPMLIPYAIPGQEKENMDFLFTAGAALDVRKLDSFNGVLDDLIKTPEMLNEMRKTLNRIYQNYSVEGIIELTNRLINNSDFGFFQAAL